MNIGVVWVIFCSIGEIQVQRVNIVLVFSIVVSNVDSICGCINIVSFFFILGCVFVLFLGNEKNRFIIEIIFSFVVVRNDIRQLMVLFNQVVVGMLLIFVRVNFINIVVIVLVCLCFGIMFVVMIEFKLKNVL